MTTSMSPRLRRSPSRDAACPPVRIVVVDDHSLVRSSIRRVLGTAGDMEWVGEASDGTQAVEIVTRTQPDVVLMDLSMPGVDGLVATRLIVSCCPATQVLVLTSSVDPARVRLSLGAGAAGVLTKDGDPATILAGIRSLVDGVPTGQPVSDPGR